MLLNTGVFDIPFISKLKIHLARRKCIARGDKAGKQTPNPSFRITQELHMNLKLNKTMHTHVAKK